MGRRIGGTVRTAAVSCPVFVVLFIGAAHAATIRVTNTNDDGDGSLRQAVVAAQNGDTLVFDAAGTINLTTGQITLDKNLTIIGPGADKLAVDAGTFSRIFYCATDGVSVAISGLALVNGYVGAGELGGGIYFYSQGGSLTVDSCEIAGCQALGSGGGIAVGGSASLTLKNSTIALCGNADYGGGIYAVTTGAVTVKNSTISGCSSSNSGGGIYLENGSLAIRNSTVTDNRCGVGEGGGIFLNGAVTLTMVSALVAGNVDNSAGPAHPDISQDGATVSASCCLIGDNTGSGLAAGSPDASGNYIGTAANPVNPELEGLGNNGGPTRTHALGADSPALDRGSNPDQLVTDQRGRYHYRLYGAGVDIGAYEYQPTRPIVTGVSPTANPRPTWSWTGGGRGNGHFRYQLDGESAGGWIETTDTVFTAPLLTDGWHTLYVQEQDVVTGQYGSSGAFSIFVDTAGPAVSISPNYEMVTGTPITFTFSFQENVVDFSSDDITVTGGAKGAFTRITGTLYRLEVEPTAEGTVTVSVPAGACQDDLGNPGFAGSALVVYDAVPPEAPAVSGDAFTDDTTPTWTWTGGSGGNGTFRYQLDSESGVWIETTDTSFTPAFALTPGRHTLYVQERDDAGRWSESGSFTVTIYGMLIKQRSAKRLR
ncbi:MAG: right-handed parallel beta-helix repeat-containing protein [Planctomycetota bacterium]|nr:right-handed parallel beta-helix repeat-containing protein [Planctomycetota bacterium]